MKNLNPFLIFEGALTKGLGVDILRHRQAAADAVRSMRASALAKGTYTKDYARTLRNQIRATNNAVKQMPNVSSVSAGKANLSMARGSNIQAKNNMTQDMINRFKNNEDLKLAAKSSNRFNNVQTRTQKAWNSTKTGLKKGYNAGMTVGKYAGATALAVPALAAGGLIYAASDR